VEGEGESVTYSIPQATLKMAEVGLIHIAVRIQIRPPAMLAVIVW
jgi:hypothetical protein